MQSPAQSAAANGRLDSWKDIAGYLGRDVRTAIRWEKERGLPVHRVPGGQRQAVFAYRSEIDDWMHGRSGGAGIGLVEVREPADAGMGAGDTALSPHNLELEKVTSGGAGIEVPEERAFSRVFSTRTMAAARIWPRMRMIALGIFAVAAGALGVGMLRPERTPQIANVKRLSRDALIKTGLATDGINVYFGEHTQGRIELSWMSIQGGAAGHIATPFPTAVIQDVDGAGRELLVIGKEARESEAGLWIVPVDGRPPRRVGGFTCHSAAHSPDGKAIAYASGTSIFITLDGGATSRELKRFDVLPSNLSWDKSGKRLRFNLESAGAVEFQDWEIELDESFKVAGVSRSALKPEPCCLNSMEVSGYEFFTTRDGRDEMRMWAVPQHRPWWRHAELLSVDLPSPLNSLSKVVADPRANRLLAIIEEPVRAELVRFEPSSQGSTPFLAGVSAKFPDISPDGHWIAYTGMDEESLWISRADGSGRKRLTQFFERVMLPRWSPEGGAIAFTARKPGGPWRIYVISREGGTPREVSSGDENQGAATWSPDGKWLVYADTICYSRKDCAVRRVEIATGKIEAIPGSAGLRTARWSPDGRYIAALQAELHQLLLFDFTTKSWTKISDASTGDDLSWSRDSQYIYWDRPTGDQPAIFRLRVAGGSPEVVVDLEQSSQLTGLYDGGLCVAPDGSVILLHRVSSSEIYAADWSVR